MYIQNAHVTKERIKERFMHGTRDGGKSTKAFRKLSCCSQQMLKTLRAKTGNENNQIRWQGSTATKKWHAIAAGTLISRHPLS